MGNGVAMAAVTMEVASWKRDGAMMLGVAVGWHGSVAIVEAFGW